MGLVSATAGPSGGLVAPRSATSHGHSRTDCDKAVVGGSKNDDSDGWWLPPRSATSHGSSGGHTTAKDTVPLRQQQHDEGGGTGWSSVSAAAGGMGELLAGLRRCVHLLVATMRTTANTTNTAAAAAARVIGLGEAPVDEVGSILSGIERTLVAEAAEGTEAVEPVLMRALCEIVRCAEERSLGELWKNGETVSVIGEGKAGCTIMV